MAHLIAVGTAASNRWRRRTGDACICNDVPRARFPATTANNGARTARAGAHGRNAATRAPAMVMLTKLFPHRRPPPKFWSAATTRVLARPHILKLGPSRMGAAVVIDSAAGDHCAGGRGGPPRRQ